MFLKTLKHFAILKLKELLVLLYWVGLVLGIAIVALAPGQIILRNPEHFTFLGIFAKVDPQHPYLQLWLFGACESMLFWLCVLFVVTLGFGIISVLQNFRYGLGYKWRFKRWVRLHSRSLIATGFYLSLAFTIFCFFGGISYIFNHSGSIVVKIFVVAAAVSILGWVIFVASSILCFVVTHTYTFFRNNWRAAKVLAEKEHNAH